MKLYALSGPPGSGKSYYKKQHFPNLTLFDIADVYAKYYGIESKDAFADLLNQITEFAATDNCSRDIVVEAFLKSDSVQRTWLNYVAEANGYEVEYIEFDTPLEMCILRVRDDWRHANQNDLATRAYFNARIKILKALLSNAKHAKEHQNQQGSDAGGTGASSKAE